jgi:peptidoglycan hydrolase-like protein with peptidoglycan-binding domain
MLLTIAGYNVSLDGQQGQDSYAAISDFQQRNGMAVTGIADAELWTKLCSSLAVLASVGE